MNRRTFLMTSAGLTAAALAARADAAARGPWTGAWSGAMAPAAAAGGGAAADADTAVAASGAATVMTAAGFHASRRFAATRFGRIAYVQRGSGPVLLCLHGLPLNGFHWRGVIARLASRRRCLAPDFLGLGYTEAPADQDLSPAAQAAMLVALLDALQIDAVDVIANDSGGAIAQILAARHPARVRTLLLTNCDTHTNSPPQSIAGAMEMARQGTLADLLARHLADKTFARSPEGLFSVCYADPSKLTDEAIDCYLTPLLSSPARRRQFHGYLIGFEPNPLPAIEPLLRRSPVPVRMVWGTADIHFDERWADWLDRTFPQSRGVRRVPGAKLFFAEEQPELIAEEAIALWRAAPPRASGGL